jgi:hypothetical protein
LAAWLTMLLQLFISWRSMGVEMHYDLVTLLVLLGALWGRLAHDKGREPDLFLLSVTTAIILAFVRRLV